MIQRHYPAKWSLSRGAVIISTSATLVNDPSLSINNCMKDNGARRTSDGGVGRMDRVMSSDSV